MVFPHNRLSYSKVKMRIRLPIKWMLYGIPGARIFVEFNCPKCGSPLEGKMVMNYKIFVCKKLSCDYYRVLK